MTSYQNPNPLRRLFQSSKAIVVMTVTSAVFLLVFREKTTFHDAAEFLKWVLGPWLLAQGVEDAAKKMGEGRGEAQRESAAALRQLSESLRPPEPNPTQPTELAKVVLEEAKAAEKAAKKG